MQKLFAISLAGALAFGVNTTAAQDKASGQAVQAIQKENSVPPNTGDSKSEQGGKAEPSSKVPHTNPDPNVFVNGVLSVPGAITDVDTAPAKFSARTDADDQVPIAGYRLKHLTSEQRNEIVQALGSQREGPAAGDNGAHAAIGAEISLQCCRGEAHPRAGVAHRQIPRPERDRLYADGRQGAGCRPGR